MTKPATKDGATEPNPAPKVRNPRRLRIGEVEIKGMARLLGQRLTEREACAVLGLAERSWWRWKNRQKNNGKFARLLEGVIGAKIDVHLQNIEAASTGAGPHKRADWRASDKLLSFLSPERFGTQHPPAAPLPPALPASVVTMWISNGYADTPAPQGGEVLDTWSEARLAETTTPAESTEPLGPSPTKKCPPLMPPQGA